MAETPLPGEEPPLVALRLFRKLAQAREAALALAAKEIVHRIDREGDLWVLSVEAPARELAEEELAAVEAEQQAPPPAPDPRLQGRLDPWSLFLAGVILAGAFLAQERLGPGFTDAGTADSGAIIERGEWWRCFTALLLHADLSHLAANLGFGLVFTASLLPQFGTGLAWLAIMVSGALGNAINAWGYRGEGHRSIGASTAVFAALGLLVASELYYRWALPATRTRRHLLAPLGGGLALLAFLGVGEKHEQIDFMAHCWGFLAGLLVGLPVAAYTVQSRPPRWVQPVAGLAALMMMVLAWALALR